MRPGALERAQTLLEGPLRWGSILETVLREGIFPVFLHNVRRFELPGVPPAIRTQLEMAFKVNAVRNAFLGRELVRVLDRLGQAGIPVIPLKGVALAESLYGDMAMRVCGDLDILVPRRLVGRSFQVLLRSGYESALPEETLLRVPLGNAIEYEFTRGEVPFRCRLELHWGMFCSSCNDERAAEEVWLESRPATFRGVTSRQLTPGWEFLYLAAHTARHASWNADPCGGVKWLADLHDTLSLRPPDWEWLRGAARRHGWERALEWSLRGCYSLLGTAVPREFAKPVPHHMFPKRTPVLPRFPGRPGFVLLILCRLQGSRNKSSFLFRRAFLPNFSDYSSLRLPRFLSFLYYVFRPMRLVYASAVRLLRSQESTRELRRPDRNGSRAAFPE